MMNLLTLVLVTLPGLTFSFSYINPWSVLVERQRDPLSGKPEGYVCCNQPYTSPTPHLSQTNMRSLILTLAKRGTYGDLGGANIPWDDASLLKGGDNDMGKRGQRRRAIIDNGGARCRDDVTEVGQDDRTEVGRDDGTGVGRDDGTEVGRDDGTEVGRDDGTEVGRDDGTEVGRDDGTEVGRDDGTEVGRDDGTEVGRDDGTEVDQDDRTELGQPRMIERRKAEVIEQR
ncbi:hypothetical protein ACOMHN_062445 [Nucella lapillus]